MMPIPHLEQGERAFMNREHVKNGVSLLCAAVPVFVGVAAWAAPDLPLQDSLGKQVSAVLQSLLVLLGFRFVRTTSLPAGLAQGYFWSFVEPLATSLPHRPPAEVGGKRYDRGRTRLEVWLPEVVEADETHPVGLAELWHKAASLPEVVIDTAEHGLRTVRVQESPSGDLVIVDVPRTLDVLERSLARELGDTSSRKRQKLAARELEEFATCLCRSIGEQRGTFFQRAVSVKRIAA